MRNDLPAGAEVFADPLIEKVFSNLMDNAIRHGGKITNIRLSVQECNGSRFIVCEDDGEGISTDEKKNSNVDSVKNTGMELYLSYEILAITGITNTYTSEPGKDAHFEKQMPDGMDR